ncbi:MAG: Gfo/Idh/MocA family oxidoreductase, partial [Gemmatimonadetes bacterium]|nr:Gfo/Idh/MocA family oxidoreductase [Gemmatimonadota bacterium]
MSTIAVVGAGAWGKNLVRNFHSLDALGMICDKDQGVLAKMSTLYPGVPLTEDFEDVLANPDLAGIAIATPAETHFELARQTLAKGGKHLFVEKPLALSAADGAELIRLAEEGKRVLMVGHLLHYHPAVLKLRDMVEAGQLGRIHYIYSTRLSMGKIRCEENVLWSFAPHDVSMIILLLGEMPTAVRTSAGNHLRRGFPDVTTTIMEFASGAQGHVFTSWLHPVKEQKIVVVGDKAMSVFDDLDAEKLRLFQHRVEWQGGNPVATKGSSRPIPVRWEEPLKAECRHFLASFSNGQAPHTDGREALRVLSVLDACQRSLEQGGVRVLIKEDKDSDPVSSAAHPNPFVHETAVVDPGATIGAGTKIWHFSHVLPDTTIGSGCVLGQNVMVGPGVTVGDGCKIQNNVSIYRGVTLERDVFCGPSAVFTNVRNPRAAIPRMDELQTTLV